VAEIRYKDKKGNDIDRWTMVTDDFSSLTGGVSGHTRTLGMDFQLYYADKAHTRICAVVTYVYAGSPAAEKGMGRGDVVLTVDGREMTPENYRNTVSVRRSDEHMLRSLHSTEKFLTEEETKELLRALAAENERAKTSNK
jgi:C-terminal processing protease CtpA/Prc